LGERQAALGIRGRLILSSTQAALYKTARAGADNQNRRCDSPILVGRALRARRGAEALVPAEIAELKKRRPSEPGSFLSAEFRVVASIIIVHRLPADARVLLSLDVFSVSRSGNGAAFCFSKSVRILNTLGLLPGAAVSPIYTRRFPRSYRSCFRYQAAQKELRKGRLFL
jgi:hypothetical protein